MLSCSQTHSQLRSVLGLPGGTCGAHLVRLPGYCRPTGRALENLYIQEIDVFPLTGPDRVGARAVAVYWCPGCDQVLETDGVRLDPPYRYSTAVFPGQRRRRRKSP